jgi:hypothetical protein
MLTGWDREIYMWRLLRRIAFGVGMGSPKSRTMGGSLLLHGALVWRIDSIAGMACLGPVIP